MPLTDPRSQQGTPYFPRQRHGEFSDWRGRRYLVGDTPRDLIGHDRSWVLAKACVALLFVGALQYGYGTAVPALAGVHGWSLPEAMAPLALWAVLQGGFALPTTYLRARGVLTPARAMVAGAALCAVALLTLGHAQSLAWVLLGYGVAGGIGVSLIYHTATQLVSAWYPERPSAHAGLASGAFALGATALILAAGVGLTPQNFALTCTVLAVVIGTVVALCGHGMAAPPANWWPPHLDPRQWALDKQLNPGLVGNPPACREHSPREAWRSGTLPTMYAILALAGAVSLFNIAYLTSFLLSSGASLALASGVTATLVTANGAGRIIASRVSDQFGRRRTLGAVLATGVVAQLGLLHAGLSVSVPALVCFAVLAGLGGGAFYPLMAAMTVDYFGNRYSTHNHGLVYSAKVVGGLLGIGGTALLLTLAPQAHTGYTQAFYIATAFALVAAWLTSRLRRPGHVRTLPTVT